MTEEKALELATQHADRQGGTVGAGLPSEMESPGSGHKG